MLAELAAANAAFAVIKSAVMNGKSIADVATKVSDYVNEVGCNTCYIYGTTDGKINPSTIQQPIISSSFARHNISVNFEYNDNTSHTDLSYYYFDNLPYGEDNFD